MTKIRNPFKDKLLRWKDDITPKEKIVWSIVIAIPAVITGRLLNRFGFLDWIKEVFNSLS